MNQWRFRPARDLDLPFAARLRSHRRERGLIGLAGNAAWLASVRGYMAVAHRLEITGREHVPLQAPFVAVANHSSHLDALALSAALPWPAARRALALAAGDVFFRALGRAMFAVTALNALPIWRDNTTAADLALLRRRLVEDGFVYLLFPEGTRARDGVMRRFRPGVGALIAGSDTPLLPCFIDGAFRCWPAGSRAPRPGKLRVTFGAPLRFPSTPNDGAGWRAVAQAAEESVRALGGLTPAADDAPSPAPAPRRAGQ